MCVSVENTVCFTWFGWFNVFILAFWSNVFMCLVLSVENCLITTVSIQGFVFMNVNIKQKAKTCSRYMVKVYSYIQCRYFAVCYGLLNQYD